MAGELGEADLAFLQTAEAELTAVSDRMLVLACTLIWLLSDYLVQRLCPFPPAPEADKLYLRDELHEASLAAGSARRDASARLQAFALAVESSHRGLATVLRWRGSRRVGDFAPLGTVDVAAVAVQVGRHAVGRMCCVESYSALPTGTVGKASTKKKSTDGELGGHKDWTVRTIDGLEVDIEEPDLYIPTMGFVTYVVLYGVVRGIQETFAPEVLSATISSALVILVVEMALMKGALFMAGAVNTPTLDLLALLGYKFFYLSLHLGVGLLCGHGRRPSGFFYALPVCGLHISCAIALWQALRRLARLQPSHGQECVTDMHQMCIKVLPIVQSAVCWMLLPSWPKVAIANAPEEVTIAITTTAASVLSGNSSAF
ncbi:yif1b [Symbiodinium sp. CCMP2456]|nr:yif1b [Symbiodinium sp. CCMP2456]